MIPLLRSSVPRAGRPQPSSPSFLSRRNFLGRSHLLSTLAVLEHREGKIQNASLAVSAALKLGGPVTGFLAGSKIKTAVAAEAAKINGLEKVIVVENEAYDKVRARTKLSHWSSQNIGRVFQKVMRLS
jgi:electron transfer flavoprotein alpha subunit